MMSGDSMRLGGQAMSAILGGTGIFYLWCSFYVPVFGFKAAVLLGAATAITLLLHPDSLDGTGGTFRTLRRIAIKATTRKPRR